MSATVSSLKPYGAFVRIKNLDRDGLVHISEASSERVDQIEDVLQLKQPLYAKVVAMQNGKISLSLKDVDQVTGEDMNPNTGKHDTFDYSGSNSANKQKPLLPPASFAPSVHGSAEPPGLFSVQQGTIFRLMEFGIFVAMDGYREHGLVHISQIRHFRIEKIADIYSEESVGSRVWVKVIGVQREPRIKISLSLKFVNQQTGQDLDPENKLLQDEQAFKAASQVKPGTGASAAQNNPSPLTIANNTLFCVRCGTVGHEEAACPFYRKAAPIELKSDDEEGEAMSARVESVSSEPSDSSESSESEDEKESKKAKKKTKKKAKSEKKHKTKRDDAPKSRDAEVHDFLLEAQRLRQLRKAKKAKDKRKKSKK